MDKIYQYISRQKWIEWLFFGTCFWLVIVHLHLNRGLDDLIHGYHYWRKADTYAQILNYYYNGFRFFDHGLYFNQMESGGKAVAEFPLFYYWVALQLKIFGNHIIVLKINWLIIMFGGQFALYRIACHFTRNHILSLIVPFILFLSPTYVIYTIEFLPDPIALHLGFIGFYFLLRYHLTSDNKRLIFALIFISISGMMKPFFIVPYIAYCLTLFLRRIKEQQSVLKLWPLLIPFALIGFWFMYVNWYNNQHGSHYFLSKLMPIWKNKGEAAASITEKISSKWLDTYFHPIYLNILTGLLLIGLLWTGYKKNKEGLFVVISLIGAICYFVLLFGMFNQHDYYIFPVLFMMPLVVLLVAYHLTNLKWHFVFPLVIGLVALVFMLKDMHFSWQERQRRLKSRPISATYAFKPYQNLDHFLKQHGVGTNDLILAFSDKSPSYALMLMNRKGWSGFQTFYRREKVIDLIDLGAKYMVVNTDLPSKRDSVSLAGVNLDYIADTNKVFIYKLIKE